MIATILTSTALIAAPAPEAFGPPVSDAELGLASPGLRAAAVPMSVEGQLAGMGPGVARDQMDVWWAENGMLLIADAARPFAALSPSLDIDALRSGTFAFRYNASVSSMTRP